jgi:hypothetical protein
MLHEQLVSGAKDAASELRSKAETGSPNPGEMRLVPILARKLYLAAADRPARGSAVGL